MPANRVVLAILLSAMLCLSGPAVAEAPQPESETTETDNDQVGDNSPLAINEPMYYVVGGSGDTKARFQLSLKYRIFDPEGIVSRNLPLFKQLHASYTQTSLWNLEAEDRPFEDSSYRPGVFWEFSRVNPGLAPDFLRVGFEHESNGSAEERARSVNTVFVLPAWTLTVFDRDLVLAPKLYAYTSLEDENEDIADFRGYADYALRYGRERGEQIQLMYRRGRASRETWQIDLSVPVRRSVFDRTGGYLYLQAFKGYGESLLVYDERRDWQVRLGFAVVR